MRGELDKERFNSKLTSEYFRLQYNRCRPSSESFLGCAVKFRELPRDKLFMKRKQINEEEEEEEEEGTSETQAVRHFEIFLTVFYPLDICYRAASSSTSNFLTQTLT
jgi:hypothetical protein